VTADPGAREGRLTAGAFSCPVLVGRGGVIHAKREGDGATPAGMFSLRQVLYRPDREAPPATGLPVAAIGPDDGWSDDPLDPAYNRAVRHPYGASAERLWRRDRLYDLIVVVGHNDAPPVPGDGSAVFIHLASPRRTPTAGCLALRHDDLLQVLARLGPATRLEIIANAVI
ncbi:MAG: L,D-transpeptidase family protein, partial [Alphaproteobacteria bacterium]